VSTRSATPPAVRLSKNQRQHLVAKLLARHPVSSQEQLVALLAAEHVTATQATVSRDLDDLGAIKVRADGGDTIYAIPDLPKDQRAPDEHLRRALADWVVEVNSSANLVVLRTPPGTANVVGAAIDRSGWPEIIGTVAGDDTLLVVADEGTGGRALAERLRALTGLT
jgi:transcriptional regulator of arginine metabolism